MNKNSNMPSRTQAICREPGHPSTDHFIRNCSICWKPNTLFTLFFFFSHCSLLRDCWAGEGTQALLSILGLAPKKPMMWAHWARVSRWFAKVEWIKEGVLGCKEQKQVCISLTRKQRCWSLAPNSFSSVPWTLPFSMCFSIPQGQIATGHHGDGMARQLIHGQREKRN